MKSPLIIDVWGKQSSELKPATQSLSTRQLMSQDKNIRGRTRQSAVSIGGEDERYRMLCEINTYKRRAERMNKKLVNLLFCVFGVLWSATLLLAFLVLVFPFRSGVACLPFLVSSTGMLSSFHLY